MEKTDNELIEDFWVSHGGKPHWKPDISFYESSWDWLMPVCVKLKIDYICTDINKAYESVVKEIKERNLERC